MKTTLLIVICGLIHIATCDVSFVVSTQKKQTAMMKIYRNDTTGEMTECYTFADQDIIEQILAAENVVPNMINPAQFKKLLKECSPIGERAIKDRLARDHVELTQLGKAISAERRKLNEDMKKAKTTEKAAKGAKWLFQGGNDIAGRKRRFINLGYELLYGIYPGTLWCGRGNIAEFAEDSDGLGELKELDDACRTHDHCPISVPGWSTALGLTNISPITCSDCSCDEVFRDSLMTINDYHSNYLGDIFFNVASIDCVRLVYPRVCVDYDWFGIFCLEYARDVTAPMEYEFYDGLTYPSS